MNGWRTTALVLVIASATLVTSCGSSVEPPPPAPSPSQVVPSPPPPSPPTPAASASASASVGKTEVAPSEATAEIYVSPTGSDDSQGTQAAPLRSVERAAKLARPGTEVIVGDVVDVRHASSVGGERPFAALRPE